MDETTETDFTFSLNLTESSLFQGFSMPPTENSPAYSSEYTTYYYEYDPAMFDGFQPCVYTRHGATFLPAIYIIFFLLGVLGNSLVFWVITCGARLRTMTDVCLLNLAIADLLLVCCLPFLAHQAWDQWVFGDAMCKIVLGIYHIVFYCGIFFITLMSIDRYLAIVHAVCAMRARTRSFAMIAAAVTWGAGFLASFPDLIFLQEQRNVSGQHTCYPGFPEIIWRLLNSQSSKKQAIRLVVIVVAIFFCCWIPYNIASLARAQELKHHVLDCGHSKAVRLALQITEAIAYSHSCLNPILYVFVGEKFRRHLLRMINRSPCRLCQLIKVFIPQDRISTSVYSQTTSVDERSTAM
ncbi:C-C chemokine receptor type 5 isoform X3 [Haplochromis burtoni]|uniref:C-C chemokine receptor type 5 isoform X3 n=1 Tax=Haplochromis burtoni TaxID=8153 RepID=UPI0003BD8086|nr:C-C chemokine receptor type 5 isoform X3 [Haplochromis burtoni]